MAAAIELAQALDSMPRRLIVYGVEGQYFDAATALTPEVETATLEAVNRILTELRQHAVPAQAVQSHQISDLGKEA
jgi:hydrogenase maturation protease